MSLNIFRHSIVAPMVCAGLLFSGMVEAQDAAKAAQVIDTVVPFSLPAQPLADALNSVAVQANLQIFFEHDTAAGLSAPPISGNMSVRAALDRLLANTNLEYLQDSGGAILVQRKTVVHVRHKVPARKPATPAEIVATAPSASAPSPAMQPVEHSWELRLRTQYQIPLNGSGALATPGIGAGLSPATAYTGNRWAPELDLEYFLNEHWSTELALSGPQQRNLDLREPAGAVSAGDVKIMPGFLTLKYNFNRDGNFRPYAGAGLSVTSLHGLNAGTLDLSRTVAGPAIQAGFDLRISDHWALNADIKWARERPTVSYEAGSVGHLRLDPLLLGIGVGYKFGGSPSAPAQLLPASATQSPP